MTINSGEFEYLLDCALGMSLETLVSKFGSSEKKYDFEFLGEIN